ncbi:hypothetical protein SPBR_05605 [Sporothrix brasiliensis 5110]|uniref:DUF3074 domain-containing protein n=1 Tax=Sporothrix brasiliensis 5110 TaxID=1398154 RepID=A0A0C2FT05_9PEZI|nr:uncharacterized protein SPBR_05605 [Sporothrix brasiliensis 5110]KIH94123.1 hypothetical protein SPBR_05605 [Sporothrix brasiliensis 5110]
MSINDNPLAALGPVSWDNLDQDVLDQFLSDTFACAQILTDSIPTTASVSTSSSSTGRPRSQTDGAVSYGLHLTPVPHHGAGTATPSTAADDMSAAKAEKLRQDLRQSWKEVKTGGSNPRNIVVYKMNGGRDGYAGSSWFARRSVHRVEKAKPAAATAKDKQDLIGRDVEIGLDMFRRALLKEFALPETGDADGQTSGSSTVRTMITKKRVEHVVVNGQGHDAHDDAHEAEEEAAATRPAKTHHGHGDKSPVSRQLDVYLLEAEFPGPTTARDFVTMLLTTQGPCQSPPTPPSPTTSSSSPSQDNGRGLRQFMVVSKPCQHPETPQRPGYVRAQYESVEVIREVRVPVAESAARRLASNSRKTRSSIDLGHADTTDTDASDLDSDGHETAIEWLMITRNNPGGNVPRFLVDRSTPSSIISDANKFLDWMVAQHVEETLKTESKESKELKTSKKLQEKGVAAAKSVPKTPLPAAILEEEDEEVPAQREALNKASDIDLAGDDATCNNGDRSSTSPSMTILSLESSGGAASSTKLFNMLSGALGGAGTAVASKLPNPFGSAAQILHSSYESQLDVDDDDNDDDNEDEIGFSEDSDDMYSDIDHADDVIGEEIMPSRRGQSTHELTTRSTERPTAAVSTDTASAGSAASIQPPPPTTALEMMAHDRALALRRENRSLTGLSTGGSSVMASDIDNDTETGSAVPSSKKRNKIEQLAAAKAAKAAKAADAARRKHEKELQKLQDRQRKAELDILKANKGKTGLDIREKEKGDIDNSAQSTKSADSATNVSGSASAAAAHSSSSSISADPANTELQKLREKHDRAVARQEAQYRREMEKIEKKRQQNAAKEAARLRKQQERDDKADTARQLTHARAERDVARKEVEMLAERVRQLEAQNELLAAEMTQATGNAKLNAKVEDAGED